MQNRMAIVASYFHNERCGLLGPQMAATIIQENTDYECVVVAVAREDDRSRVSKALADYFGPRRPVVGFSSLSGRTDLFDLARQMRVQGAVTFLAGPQAAFDFVGEVGWQSHPHRFCGVEESFDFALQGPAEQAIAALDHLGTPALLQLAGLVASGPEDAPVRNRPRTWASRYLDRVSWHNLYSAGQGVLVPIAISSGQVLQRLGCPYAKKERRVEIDYPASMTHGRGRKIGVSVSGCSFCDVAVDKGYHGALDLGAVLSQIECLPEQADGRKIPFELIDENPLPDLVHLLSEVRARAVKLSRIDLILRADWLVRGAAKLRDALGLAADMELTVLLGSVGFESFDDAILQNLNKGLTTETNLNAVRLMRQLKQEFPDHFGYARRDGAVHGFIHPTPWDTEESAINIRSVFEQHGLERDIIPSHSTPLIIHHASGLGDWIRAIEAQERIRYKRFGSIIGWWETKEPG